MGNSLSIAVLITNYNTWKLTQCCIDKIYEYGLKNIEKIVVVNDASTEASSQNLSSKVEIIENSKNYGYVASVNIGVKYITQDLIVLLDSDAYPVMDIFSSVSQHFLEDSSLGALSLHLVDKNGKPTGNREEIPNLWGLLLGQKFYGKLRKKSKKNKPFVCYSCGVVIRRKAFLSINGFDESFDFLDGDIDFFMRLRLHGWKLKVSETLQAFHMGSGSPQSTAKRVIRFYRNRYKFLEKHNLLPNRTIFCSLLFLRHISEYLFLSLFGFFIFEKKTLCDKKKSRLFLLKRVWHKYEK